MRVHITRTYIGAIATLIVIFLVLGTAVTRLSVNSTLVKKQSALEASIGEINNQLQSINYDLLIPGVSSSGSAIITQTNSLITKVEEFEYPTDNIFEQIINNIQVKSLDTKSRLAKESNSNLRIVLKKVSYDINTVIKFLEYNPNEDFVELGIDSTNDLERIDRALNAFTTLSNDNKLDKEILQNMNLAINATTSFRTSGDLAQFSATILQIQKEIITILNSNAVAIKNQYSKQYNQLLYQ